jgi:hypothetical protein
MSKHTTPVADRIEVVRILMTLDPSAYERHKEAVCTLSPSFQPENTQRDDLINVTYKFTAYYYGVVKQLQAVQELCDDPEVIVTIDCAELEAQRIIIYETLKKLDNIIQQVKGRE